jgi:hypothetical protein
MKILIDIDAGQVCRDIGCSGIDPVMCKYEQHKCAIVRKVLMPRPPECLKAEQSATQLKGE